MAVIIGVIYPSIAYVIVMCYRYCHFFGRHVFLPDKLWELFYSVMPQTLPRAFLISPHYNFLSDIYDDITSVFADDQRHAATGILMECRYTVHRQHLPCDTGFLRVI